MVKIKGYYVRFFHYGDREVRVHIWRDDLKPYWESTFIRKPCPLWMLRTIVGDGIDYLRSRYGNDLQDT